LEVSEVTPVFFRLLFSYLDYSIFHYSTYITNLDLTIGVVYLALSIGGPFAAYFLRYYDHHFILGMALKLNCILTLVWAFTPTKRPWSIALFIFIRFLMGLSQCVVCVFLPLWTNTYAPAHRLASWMSYLQASVPMGVMGGYLIASVVLNCRLSLLGSHFALWRVPFLVEVCLLMPICVMLHFVPRDHLSFAGQHFVSPRKAARLASEKKRRPHPPAGFRDIDEESPLNGIPFKTELPKLARLDIGAEEAGSDSDKSWSSSTVEEEDMGLGLVSGVAPSAAATARNIEGAESDSGSEAPSVGHKLASSSILASLRYILSLEVYLLVLGAITSLYFVVTGVQFWGTSYMLVVLQLPQRSVNALFIICAATGSTSGVFFGGWFVDRLGGYKGRVQRSLALEFCFVMGTVAVLLSFSLCYTRNMWAFSLSLWTLLFCGGSILPSCSGIVLLS
jgi:MFS family permease